MTFLLGEKERYQVEIVFMCCYQHTKYNLLSGYLWGRKLDSRIGVYWVLWVFICYLLSFPVPGGSSCLEIL